MTAVASGLAGAMPLADRRTLARQLQWHFGACMLGANAIGGVIVFTFLGFVLPRSQRLLAANLIALIAYGMSSMIVGSLVSARAFRPVNEWLAGGRDITSADRVYLVRHPLRQALINFALWIGSLLLFVPINLQYGLSGDMNVASTILMGGMTTCGLTYLMAERLLRPVYEVAFQDALPEDCYIPGVKSRILLAWALGTAVPLLGVMM